MDKTNLLIIDKDENQIKLFKEKLRECGFNPSSLVIPDESLLKRIMDDYFQVIFVGYFLTIDKNDIISTVLESPKNENSWVIAYTSNKDPYFHENLFEKGYHDVITIDIRTDFLKFKIKAIIKHFITDYENLKINLFKKHDLFDYTLKGTKLNLTSKQYDILSLFIRNPGRIFSSKDIISDLSDDCCDKNSTGNTSCIRKHIIMLREKIRKVDSEKEYITTILQKGYQFNF